ncbi:MAG: hypothetical protein U5K37_04555 [Natrialbaceae archaeon]|nr:hypothetical protein [Natrialbaceae archaeon]
MANRTVFQVTKTLPDGIGAVTRVLLYLVPYFLIVGWLKLYRTEVTIETTFAEWAGPE